MTQSTKHTRMHTEWTHIRMWMNEGRSSSVYRLLLSLFMIFISSVSYWFFMHLYLLHKRVGPESQYFKLCPVSKTCLKVKPCPHWLHSTDASSCISSKCCCHKCVSLTQPSLHCLLSFWSDFTRWNLDFPRLMEGTVSCCVSDRCKRQKNA